MARRHWKNLDPATTYVMRAENGWAFTMNADGTVSLGFHSTTAAMAGVDMSVDPDPGGGEKYPPTGP